MTLQECDHKSVSVVVDLQGAHRVLHGKATYVTDPALGNCLRIEIDDPASPGLELLLREGEWTGRITSDQTHGSEAVVYLDANSCPS